MEKLLKIRFHGRGGQGAVTAVTLFGEGIVVEGKHARGIPEFGVERRGAPVRVHLYVDNKKIAARCPILDNSDCDIFFDKSLIYKFYEENCVKLQKDLGLKKDGWIIVNTSQSPQRLISEFEFLEPYKIATVAASKIALEHGIGSSTSPIVNTTILGTAMRVLNVISMSTLAEVMREKFGKNALANIQASQKAYTKTRLLESE